MVWIVVASFLTGCGANEAAALTDEVEALTRRVATLEQKVKRLEGGKPAKGGKNSKVGKGKTDKSKGGKGKTDKSKGGKGKTDKSKGGKNEKTKKPAPPKGTIKVTGDAVKVMVANDQRKFAVPNQLAPGSYTVMAAFGAETTLTEYGPLELAEGQTVSIDCQSTVRRCTALPQ